MAKTLRSEVADKFGGAINAGALKSLVNQVARAMEGQKTLADEIKDICAQGDEAGIASKREIRRLAREQLMSPDVLTAQLDRMADLRAALSDYVTTPLGEAAMRAEGEVNGEAWAEGSMAKATGRKPRPFAEQPISPPRRPRGRPRKDAATALADARLHLGEEPAGTA